MKRLINFVSFKYNVIGLQKNTNFYISYDSCLFKIIVYATIAFMVIIQNYVLFHIIRKLFVKYEESPSVRWGY